jgi:hypothetical protein
MQEKTRIMEEKKRIMEEKVKIMEITEEEIRQQRGISTDYRNEIGNRCLWKDRNINYIVV